MPYVAFPLLLRIAPLHSGDSGGTSGELSDNGDLGGVWTRERLLDCRGILAVGLLA